MTLRSRLEGHLRRVRSLPGRLRRRAVVERDLRAFRRRHGRTLAYVPRRDGPVALIVSMTEFVYQLKLEGMLTKALQLKGCQPAALVPPQSSVARRYFQLFGVDRRVELDDYLTDAARATASREAERLLEGPLSVEGLKGLTYRGADVGRQVLSTASRYLHHGAIDLQDPRFRELVAELLPVSIGATLAAEALLDDLRPDVMLFNERNYTEQGPLSDLALARGLNVIQFVSAFQDDAFVFKRFTADTKGLHPRSVSDEAWRTVVSMEWTDERERELDEDFARRYDSTWFLSRRIQGWTRPHSRDEILSGLGLEASRKTAVVFSHVLWDANMFYGEDLFRDQEEWFVETVRMACENDRVNWIVKLHPANVWKLRRDGADGELEEIRVLRDQIGRLPPHVALLPPETAISTRSIFELADWGVTIRGSVGIELPCFGVPVLTAGTGFYSGRGFTVDSASPEQYLERLRRIDEIPPLPPDHVLLARKHAYALFRLRPTRFTSFSSVFRPLDEVDHPLYQNVVVNLQTPEELVRADDMRRFGDWAVDSRALDYLEPLPG